MNSKLFYSMQEASEYTGVHPYTIRYWEKEYNLLHPEKDSRGRRRYRNADLELIKKIKNLIYDNKYKASGVKKKLQEAKKENIEEAELKIVKKELQEILEIVSR